MRLLVKQAVRPLERALVIPSSKYQEVRAPGSGPGTERGVPVVTNAGPIDETGFASLKMEIEAFVRGPGEDYAEEIERTHAVPPAGSRSPATWSSWNCSPCRTRRCG